MKKASVVEVKNKLSSYLAYVRRGGRVIIFNRDTPVAELVPIQGTTEEPRNDSLARSVAELARAGIVRRGTGQVCVELLEEPTGAPSGVLEGLLDERATGR